LRLNYFFISDFRPGKTGIKIIKKCEYCQNYFNPPYASRVYLTNGLVGIIPFNAI
jgi:hypothetical protein